MHRSLRSRLAFLAFLALLLTFSVSTVLAQHVIKRVSVGVEPRGVAVDPFTGHIYVANVYSGTISARAGTVMATFPWIRCRMWSQSIRTPTESTRQDANLPEPEAW